MSWLFVGLMLGQGNSATSATGVFITPDQAWALLFVIGIFAAGIVANLLSYGWQGICRATTERSHAAN